MNKEIICIAGDGWGAIAAFRSISSMFPSMEIITKDDELQKKIIGLYETEVRRICEKL